MVRENRLFVGNPGTGKSTLINCLIGKNLSRAGINWGGGLTRDYQRFEHDDIVYMDTPGLADSSIPKEAAAAITEALRQGGKYKLFFIMRLQNGRVVSEDMVTLEQVLSAIDVDAAKIRFSVVFNAVDKAQYALLSKPSSPEFALIKRVVNGRRFKTDAFCLIPVIAALNEASDALGDLPKHVTTFMNYEAVSMRIKPSVVKPVNPRGFEQQAREIQEEMERLLRENTVMQSELASGEHHHDAMQRDRVSHTAHTSRGKNNAGASLSPTVNYMAPQSPSAQSRDDKPSSSILIPKKMLVVVAVVIVVVFAVSISLVVTLTVSKSENEATSSPASSTDQLGSGFGSGGTSTTSAPPPTSNQTTSVPDLLAEQPQLVSCVGQDKLGATFNSSTTNITDLAQIAASPKLFFAIKGNITAEVVFLTAQPTAAEKACLNDPAPNASLWYVYNVTQTTTEPNSTTQTPVTQAPT